LPATKPGDAGYFPLHDNKLKKAEDDFKKEMYPGFNSPETEQK
jgi:hypothetical protein